MQGGNFTQNLKKFFQKRKIEVVGNRIEEMHSRKVAGTIGKGGNATCTAHMTGNKTYRFGESHKFVGKKIQGIVVTADTDKHLVEFLFGNRKFCQNSFVLV